MNFKFMVMKAGILWSSMSLANNLLASSEVQANNHFFSLAEIKNAPKKSLQPLLYIPATDDVALAYRTYLPQEARAMLIFIMARVRTVGLSIITLPLYFTGDSSCAVPSSNKRIRTRPSHLNSTPFAMATSD